jgi:hypothetical protein
MPLSRKVYLLIKSYEFYITQINYFEIRLSPTPPPRGRGYSGEYKCLLPFSPGRRGRGRGMRL